MLVFAYWYVHSLPYLVFPILGNLSTIPLINIDTAGAAADGVDSTGDDDAETWSQNSEDSYIGDDT